MLIDDSDVAKVLDRTDIVTLIGEHVALKRVGLRFVGLCPFHSENSPSFSVNAEEGFYYCFGCHASGDAISFLRNMERLEFVEAVEQLASKAGVALSYGTEELSKSATKRSALQSAVSRATEFYHEQLLNSKDAESARKYLSERGLTSEDWRKFSLGWAPDQVSSLDAHLSVPQEVFVDAGLGYVDHAGRLKDHLRARVIFPIFDASGKPIAFGGRILPGDSHVADRQPPAKYKNSPETALYSKRKTLYGLNLAKAEVVAKGEIIICEGYTDVIAFFKAGISRAVATCGTALTEDHFSRIRSFSKRIILAFDADGAGASATEKFYQWEKKHKLEIYVASLPEGMDPGELGQKDPDRLRAAVSGAKAFMAYRLERIFVRGDLATIEGRARVVDDAIALIAEHPNGLIRNDYLMQISDKCRFDIGDLHYKLEQALRFRNSRSDDGGAAAVRDVARFSVPGEHAKEGDGAHVHLEPISAAAMGLSDRPAVEGLKMLVHNLGEMADFFPLVLFNHPTHRALRIALEGVTQTSDAGPRVEMAGREAKELFIRLCVEAPKSEPFDVVTRLVERGVYRRLEDMKHEARMLEPSSARLTDLSRELSNIRRLQEGLRSDGSERIDSTGKLLMWLTESESEAE